MNDTLHLAKDLAHHYAAIVRFNARKAKKTVVDNKSELARIAVVSSVVYIVGRRNGFVDGFEFASSN